MCVYFCVLSIKAEWCVDVCVYVCVYVCVCTCVCVWVCVREYVAGFYIIVS